MRAHNRKTGFCKPERKRSPETNLVAGPWSYTSSLQNGERTGCCESYPVWGISLCQPELTNTICIYHLICKVKSRTNVYLLSGPISRLLVLLVVVQWRLCASHTYGESAPQSSSISVSLAGLWGLEGAGGTYQWSAHLNVADTPPFLLTSWTHVATCSERCRISIYWFQYPSDPGRGFFWWAPTGSTLMCLSNSQSGLHPDWDHVGMTILLTLMARPLAITSKSVCTQTLGLLLFNSPITARKTTCNPDHGVGLFLPSSIRTLPPASLVWQPLEKDPVHKPTSSLLVN